MSVGQEVKVATFPYIPLVILSALIGFGGTVWLYIMPAGIYNLYNMGYALCVMYFMSGPIIVLLISAVLSRIRLIGRYLTPVNLTLLYIVSFMASWFVNVDNLHYMFSYVVTLRYTFPADSLKVYPLFVAPVEDVAKQLVTGGGVSWGAWTPTILFWWLYQVMFGLFWVALASIFRKQWIDVEKIPFTHTLVAAELLKRTGGEPSMRERLGRPFLVGAILGIAFQVPIFMVAVFPWFPDIYGWRTNTCPTGTQYLTTNSALAGIVGLSMFQKHPLAISIAYLAPLSVLFSTWVFYLMYIVLVQAAYVMGYYTDLPGLSGCGRAWCGTSTPEQGPPFYFYTLSQCGGLIGLSIMTLFLSRRYIASTFRTAVGRGSTKEEEGEAMGYRSAYTLLLASCVAIIAVYMALQLSPFEALLVPITAILYYIAKTRIYGSAGLDVQGGRHGWTLYRILVWPNALPPDKAPVSYYISGNWVGHGPNAPAEWFTASAMYSSFAAYKMGSLTGLSNRSALKALVIALVTTPLFSLTTMIWLNGTFGSGRFAAGSGINSSDSFSQIINWLNSSYSGPFLEYTLLGMVITIGLSLLHARFLWFPLEPIGFIIGTGFLSILWGYWLPFLIAWVLKVATLRIGGSKLYEKVGVPAAAGFAVGCIVAILIGSVLGAVRFITPY